VSNSKEIFLKDIANKNVILKLIEDGRDIDDDDDDENSFGDRIIADFGLTSHLF
jgi:hypothetical protein